MDRGEGRDGRLSGYCTSRSYFDQGGGQCRAVYAHRKVAFGVSISKETGSGLPLDVKEVAVQEGIPVVATGRAYAVGAHGFLVKGATREVADRRNIAAVDNSNYRCYCRAAGDQRAACVNQCGAASNFPGRASNDEAEIHQIAGEDFGHIPPATGHVEIVIHTGELAGAELGVPLVREAVEQISVAIIPKWARRRLGANGCVEGKRGA